MSSYLDRMTTEQYNEWVQRSNGMYGLARLGQNLDLPTWLVEEIADIRRPSGKSVPMLAMFIITALEDDKNWCRFTPELQRQLLHWLRLHAERINDDDRLTHKEELTNPKRESEVGKILRDDDVHPRSITELRNSCRRLHKPIS